MQTSQLNAIKGWCEDGVSQGATHLVVVCDTYDNENYPVYVMKYQSVKDVCEEYDGKRLQAVVACHDLTSGKVVSY